MVDIKEEQPTVLAPQPQAPEAVEEEKRLSWSQALFIWNLLVDKTQESGGIELKNVGDVIQVKNFFNKYHAGPTKEMAQRGLELLGIIDVFVFESGQSKGCYTFSDITKMDMCQKSLFHNLLNVDK